MARRIALSPSLPLAALLGLALALCAGGAGVAHAQAPDIREIRPVVMMLVDTSGSMEYELGSESGPTGRFPNCTGSTSVAGSTHSRWTALLSAMTGSWESYACTTIDRNIYAGAPDQHYALDYHMPMGITQRTDGILDVYVDRVKFGLMTYDNIFGLDIGGTSNLLMVAPSIWAARGADVTGPLGDYSYGDNRTVSFPGCSGSFYVNSGARREALSTESFGGSLISVGTDLDDHRLINARVQAAMLAARPFGSTPTAALLDDFLYYLQNDPDVAASTSSGSGDPYAACRARYAILITDGQPSDPYRTMGCDTAGYTCPYRLPSEIASDLCLYDGTACTGPIDGLYVVGYEVSDPTAAALLDDIAGQGGTGTAYRADDSASLLASLSRALDRAATGTTTRTTPAFAESAAVFTPGSTGTQQRYQFTSGFVVGLDGAPWTGVLDRTRFACVSGTAPPEMQPLDPGIDSFHNVLDARDLASQPRQLYTALVSDPSHLDEVLIGDVADTYRGALSSIPSSTSLAIERGVDLTRFESANLSLTAADFGLVSGTLTARNARRDEIIDWVHGEVGTVREGARLGDIYHSSPVVVGPPRADIADESYNAFRRLPAVAERPTVLYVGTNDGILHAFAVEDHTVSSGRTVRAGEELWGFIPPALLGRLDAASASHQFMVDGTPVVREMFMARTPGDLPAATNYRTTLVTGLRAGGNVYIALDVSDPLASSGPTLLWQFRGDDMGATYGRPGLAQVFVDVGGALQQRAVAILPGGHGEIDVSATLAAGTAGCGATGSLPASPPSGTGVRRAHRCWAGRTGRALYVVDVATGIVLREFDADDGVGSPITGGVSVYTGDVGTIATRAYTTDADGLVWRLDMTSRNLNDWTFRPIVDLYWNDGAMDGNASTEPPIITTDAADEVVVIVATGDLDNLETDEPFRIASFTDAIDRTTGVSYTTTMNWEIHLPDGEQVTGPLELFDSRVYFGTFSSNATGGNACEYGSSRIWGVGYLATSATVPAGYSAVSGRFPTPGLASVVGSGVYDRHFVDAGSNAIVMGVAVTRTPTCVTGDTLPDPYLGNRFRVSSATGGEFRLVAGVSGGRAAGSGLTASGGAPGESAVGTVSTTLATPPSVTYVTDWAGAADY